MRTTRNAPGRSIPEMSLWRGVNSRRRGVRWCWLRRKSSVSKARSLKSKDAAQKQQKKPAKKPREKMADGELCKSHKYTWKVIKILGSGGFGDVYKVVKNGDEDKNEYAMKTEMVIGERRMLRLKIEVACMMQCRLSNEGKKHFVELVDRGKTDKFKFVVMGLVGSSLDDYRKNNKVDFTLPTAMQVAVQTLEAIRDLHKVGWLHRDIKPQNFAHGIGDNEGTVFVLDFGIARKIYDKNQVLKKPRAKVKFLGTLRYASRACHHGAEQGRKDDMETWLYLMLDLFNRVKGLPWKKEQDKSMIIVRKEKFFDKAFFDQYYTESLELLKGFWPILDHINKCDYYKEPGYAMMEERILAVAKEKNIDMTAKMDWTVRKETAEKKEPTVDAGEEKAPEDKAPEEKPEELEEDKQEGEDDNGDDGEEELPGVKKKGKKKTATPKPQAAAVA